MYMLTVTTLGDIEIPSPSLSFSLNPKQRAILDPLLNSSSTSFGTSILTF